MILSQHVKELNRKARAIIADLLPMLDDPRVNSDPCFVALLDQALNLAQFRLKKKAPVTERKMRETITHHGKTVES